MIFLFPFHRNRKGKKNKIMDNYSSVNAATHSSRMDLM